MIVVSAAALAAMWWRILGGTLLLCTAWSFHKASRDLLNHDHWGWGIAAACVCGLFLAMGLELSGLVKVTP